MKGKKNLGFHIQIFNESPSQIALVDNSSGENTFKMAELEHYFKDVYTELSGKFGVPEQGIARITFLDVCCTSLVLVHETSRIDW